MNLLTQASAKSAATLVLLAATAAVSQANLVISYAANAGSAATPVSNAITQTFDTASSGGSYNWEGVGTYTGVTILNADIYGGAGGVGKYLSQSNVARTTLTLDTSIAYFGLWWSAGDKSNALEFYNGNTLLFSFTTQSLLEELAAAPAYTDNPFWGGFNNEKYAYINFFGQQGTNWDKIVLTNVGGTNFESDNHAVRVGEWTKSEGPIPGVIFENLSPVPEPSSVLALGALIGCGAFLRSRRH